MAKKKHKPPVSQAQARLFGAVAGGITSAAPGLGVKRAKDKLRGVKVSKLPERAKKKKR